MARAATAWPEPRLPGPPDRAQLDALWRGRVINDVIRLLLAGRELEQARETLDRRYLTFERRIRELNADDVFQIFLNAYAAAMDPHSAYMGPRASENFQIAMRLSLEGIGAVLQRQDEYTVVRSVVPGGPAARSGLDPAGRPHRRRGPGRGGADPGRGRLAPGRRGRADPGAEGHRGAARCAAG
ncbi:MAG: hypothetical protein RML12_01695 [Xanthomonadales bacterium]|nr:hypothetical protein [Xanthomonadales bacterium]